MLAMGQQRRQLGVGRAAAQGDGHLLGDAGRDQLAGVAGNQV